MALNFSHCPIFPAHLSEENLVSPMRIANGYMVDGIPERSGDGFIRSWHSHREVEDRYDYGRERVNRGGSPDSVSNDILDLLPSDPFGMDISTTVTAIMGCLEDLEVDYGGCGRNSMGASNKEYDLFAGLGLNLIWNSAVRFQAYHGNSQVENKFYTASQLGGYTGKELGNTTCVGGFESVRNVGNVVSFDNESIDVSGQQIEESPQLAGNCSYEDEGAPPAGLVFALRFLGVQDLLSVEMVCKSLCSTVRNDPLLWRSIHIDQPLNERITDDALLRLTSRAQDHLQSLSLVECPRITDDGLKGVLEANLRLTKLCVPRCMRLSIEGIVNSLKAFKSKGTPGVKHLRIGGRYNVTHELFAELKFLLGAESAMGQSGYKPHFYHLENFSLLCDDDRPIDIEVCPKCQKLRLVYDCPAEGCQGEDDTTQVCRACTLCIQRCIQCGRCITDNEYEETFCLDLQCSDCFKLQLECQERQDKEVGPAKSAYLRDSSQNFCLHG